ncbi:hypothetical protein ACLOJK_034596 [Asimina triloba]
MQVGRWVGPVGSRGEEEAGSAVTEDTATLEETDLAPSLGSNSIPSLVNAYLSDISIWIFHPLFGVSVNLLWSPQLVKYGLVLFFNVTMWGCYVNSLKALPALQATVTNFATNFLSSGLAGFYLFEEPLSSKVTFIELSGNKF